MKIKIRLSYVKVLVIAVLLMVIANGIGPESSDAKVQKSTSQLIESLLLIRNSLEYYRAINNGLGPPVRSFAEFRTALACVDSRGEPYLKEIPANPFNGLDTVRFNGVEAGANLAGWRLDTKSGQVQADNDAACAEL